MIDKRKKSLTAKNRKAADSTRDRNQNKIKYVVINFGRTLNKTLINISILLVETVTPYQTKMFYSA